MPKMRRKENDPMWQDELKQNITSAEELRTLLPMEEQEYEDIRRIADSFPMSISRHYFGLINPDDPDDPIRKLCIPSSSEFNREGVLDTSGEADNTKVSGLQHKYGPTVLALSTNKCGTYCRFCFRRRFVGTSEDEVIRRMDHLAEYVKSHPEADNVLVSGGDSFMNSNASIRHLLELLSEIDSLRFIRFATRMITFLPNRINQDQEFLDILAEYNQKKQIIVIAHFEHPNELTEESYTAAGKIQSIGIPIRNQTVLLRGVNDNPETMSDLMNGLVSWGIMPYYVFQCRPVTSVKKQFQVPFIEGYRIIDEAKKTMSGPAKQFRFAMSHVTGKIEIIGMLDEKHMIFKYHQAKDLRDNGRIMVIDVSDQKAWLSQEETRTGRIG